MGRNIVVVPVEDGFAVKMEEDIDSVSLHTTEAEAIEAGRAAARTEEAELIVLDETGEVRWREPQAGGPGAEPVEPVAGP